MDANNALASAGFTGGDRGFMASGLPPVQGLPSNNILKRRHPGRPS